MRQEAADVTHDPAELRRILGHFASGVTIVTGLDDDGPIGFACQSFASVSLDPALVLFCADHHGRAWSRIRRTGRFTVNVLAESQSDICSRFGSSRGAKFDGLDWDRSPWGTPSLPEVLARVHADIQTVHPAGDHDVALGRVLELEKVRDDRPLVFFRGDFGLGPTAASAR